MFAKRRTAIKALAGLALACACALASAAQVAGTVVNLSGALMARKADGTVKVLAVKSEVEQGDTLMSQKNTYAQIRFVDSSEITLKPNTTFKIEAFAFDAGKPEGDSANFNLVKGGLRSITGLLGKRNKEKFQLKTPTATIGIRGTTFTADYIEEDEAQAAAARQAFLFASTAGGGIGQAPQPSDAPATPRAPQSRVGGLAPGLHVFVIDGLIQLTNSGGSMQFSAGQFGYVRNINTPPIVVPANPSLRFTPPPSFQLSTGPTDPAFPKTDAVDCEVR